MKCQGCAREGGIYIPLKHHSDIVDIIAGLILKDATRDEVRSYALAKYPRSNNILSEDEAVNTTLSLCGSLLLMTEIGTDNRSNYWLPLEPLPWGGTQTLKQSVREHFQPEKRLVPDNPRFEGLFNAWNIQQISGITIKWTSNLADHLLLTNNDQTLFVFHCVGFLRHHQR